MASIGCPNCGRLNSDQRSNCMICSALLLNGAHIQNSTSGVSDIGVVSQSRIVELRTRVEQLQRALGAAKMEYEIAQRGNSSRVEHTNGRSSVDPSNGIELLVSAISGSAICREDPLGGNIIDPTAKRTIHGKYMAVTLGRLFLNLPMYNRTADEIHNYIIFEATWQNVWDYPMNTQCTGDIKIIDSDGFQHSAILSKYLSFEQVYSPKNNELFPVQFHWPELRLEAHSKTKGYVWFESLSEGLLPRRFVFNFSIYDPGQQSGWVRDEEKLTFDLVKFETIEYTP